MTLFALFFSSWSRSAAVANGQLVMVAFVGYAKEPHSAIVAYDDEMPPCVLAKAEKDGTHGSGYRLSDEEWKKHAQAMWQATGGQFDASLPRPDHNDI